MMKFDEIKELFDKIEEARKPAGTNHLAEFEHHINKALAHLEKHAKTNEKKDPDVSEASYELYRKIAKAREEY